jgi:hypothetical protein
MTGPIDHFDIACSVTSLYDQDGFLGIQYDAEGAEASSADDSATPGGGGVRDYEVVQPGGIFYRPLDPVSDASGTIDPTQAGQVLYFLEGGRGFALPLGDPRVTAILPTVAGGSTLLYSACGSFVRLEGSGPAQGQISIYTTDDGTTNGYVVGLNVWPNEIRMIPPGGGRHTADVTGFRWVDGSGARMTLGTQGGSVPGVSAVFDILADAATLDAPYVMLGRKGALKRGPAVRADQLQMLVIAPIITALNALTSTVEALAAAPAVNGSPPAGIAALLPALQAAVSALSEVSSPTITPDMLYASSGVQVA